MKSKFTFCKKSFVKEVQNGKDSITSGFLLLKKSKIRREMNTAVNKEQSTPMINVVANPLIGPVPNAKRMIPVNTVVMLESMIALNALP